MGKGMPGSSKKKRKLDNFWDPLSHIMDERAKLRAELGGVQAEMEATLKYFRNEGSMVRLDPANRSYDPQRYRPDQVRVQGKLAGLLRRY